MINKLPHIKDIIVPTGTTPSETVEFLNSYIAGNSCENMTIDISFMNVMDSCFVSTLCSTKHFMKYPEGKICWKISSPLVKEFNNDLELGNISYSL